MGRELTEREERLVEAMLHGVPFWLAIEAVASTEMSHDEGAQTCVLDDARTED